MSVSGLCRWLCARTGEGEFQAYENRKQQEVTISAATYKSNANMFTYRFGPVVGAHTKGFYVYGKYLGGSSSNGYASLSKANEPRRNAKVVRIPTSLYDGARPAKSTESFKERLSPAGEIDRVRIRWTSLRRTIKTASDTWRYCVLIRR